MKQTKGPAMKRRTADRLYWPSCAVCQFMKKYSEFRFGVMQSTYFNPNGAETLLAVNRRFGSPFKPAALYMHMKRHQQKDIAKAEIAAQALQEQLHGQPDVPVTSTGAINVLAAVEGQVVSEQQHERGLDDFIAEGRAKLASGEMRVTAATFLQAVKIKADIEKSTKDRRLDAFKAITGAAGRTEQPRSD